MKAADPVRAVALFEAGKGALSLLAATGLLSLIHVDVDALALRLVEHFHLNPASKYPGIFLEAAHAASGSRVLLLAAGAALYAALRGVEAYGLFRRRAWAEWLAAASGAVYVPFEVFELAREPSGLAAAFLVVNLAVVGVMVRALWVRRRAR